MFMITVDYPTRADEIEIARSTTGATPPPLQPVIHGAQVLAIQELVRRVPVPDFIFEYAVDLVRRTRPSEPQAPAWLKPLVQWGAGPRAVQGLILGARARAALQGSYQVRQEDVEAVALPVLAHRVLTNFAAESQGIDSRKVVERLVADMAREK
jgi:MoxR-like ATPase